jgi:hypothetical protein
MNYIAESIFVGLYSCIIFLLVSQFITNYMWVLFCTGFLKHLSGYLFQIHTYYCNYGSACSKHQKQKEKVKYEARIPTIQLLIECIVEGFGYILLGSLFILFIKNNLFSNFCIGAFMHILAEILGIHRYFCETHCFAMR